MGLDSESSCEEPEIIKIETTDEDCIEQTTDDNESSNKQDEKTHICAYEGCNKKFSRPSKLQAHLCFHTGERRFKCEHDGCDKSYSRPQHLRRHITTNHSIDSKYKKLLRCPYPDCMRELSNQQNLKKHYYRKHERKHPYTCQYCDKGFPKHQQLKQHLYQHTGIPPFRCSECNVGFTKVGDLNRHNRSHKTYTCSFADCGVVLKAWAHMRTHIKLKHPSEFPCDDCGRTFRTKSRLKIHATVHKEPEEREIFPCTYPNCPRFYFKKSNLTHHIKSSHEGKKFECSYEDCGRQLCTQQKLEEHMKLHRKNRPIPRRRKKSKNKRRSTGTHKRSMAVKLSGIRIPYQEIDAASADNIQSECLIEDTKLLQSTSDGFSERENVEQECNKKSNVFTQTKLSIPPSKDSLKEFSTCNLSNSNKRKVTSNRKVLANYKKLRLGDTKTKSSTSSNLRPHSFGEQDLFNCIYTPKEESRVELDTIYKGDKYIEDCLRVIDTKDFEERSKILDGILLCNRESKSGEIKTLINKRQICITEGDTNISGILDKPLALKQHLFLRKKKKLDQIVNSLRSVKSKSSEFEYSKSCRESSSTLSLKPEAGKFYIGVSEAVCSVSNNYNNLKDLCALTQEAMLEGTDDVVNSQADDPLGCIKQEDFLKIKFQGDMTIKKWLQLMKKTMEHFFSIT